MPRGNGYSLIGWRGKFRPNTEGNNNTDSNPNSNPNPNPNHQLCPNAEGLNTQIERECQAFRRGFFDVVDEEWLIMFSPVEVQAVLSGSESPIDVDDLIAHTNYGGAYHPAHRTVVMFWGVRCGFFDKHLLSRMPLIPTTPARLEALACV
jgi:hypothetical protein